MVLEASPHESEDGAAHRFAGRNSAPRYGVRALGRASQPRDGTQGRPGAGSQPAVDGYRPYDQYAHRGATGSGRARHNLAIWSAASLGVALLPFAVLALVYRVQNPLRRPRVQRYAVESTTAMR